VKYYFRLENPATSADPGDELQAQVLFGYETSPGVRIGPGVNWMISGEKKVKGTRIEGSAVQVVSAGAEFYFKIAPLSVTLSYMADVYAENAPRG